MMDLSEKRRSAVLGMLSGPGALFFGRCLNILLTSLGEVGRVRGPDVGFSDWAMASTSGSNVETVCGHLNCFSKESAKSLAFS